MQSLDNFGSTRMTRQEYIESLDKQALLAIIKYGLVGSDAPADVTVDDIYYLIGCFYVKETY